MDESIVDNEVDKLQEALKAQTELYKLEVVRNAKLEQQVMDMRKSMLDAIQSVMDLTGMANSVHTNKLEQQLQQVTDERDRLRAILTANS